MNGVILANLIEIGNNRRMGGDTKRIETDQKNTEIIRDETLFSGVFVDNIVLILDGDKSARSRFISSCTRALKAIVRLEKKGILPPLLTGEISEDEQGGSDYYKDKILETNNKLKDIRKNWTKEGGESCVESVMELLTPLYGFTDKNIQSESINISQFPDKIVKNYIKEFKRISNSFDTTKAWGSYSRQVSEDGLYSFATIAGVSLVQAIAGLAVDLSRYVHPDNLSSFPLLVGGLVLLKKMAQGYLKHSKLITNKVQESTLSAIESFETLDNRMVEELFSLGFVSELRKDCFQEIQSERGKAPEEVNDRVGLEILTKMLSLSDDVEGRSKYIHEVWNVDGSSESENVVKTAEALTANLLDEILSIENSLNSKKSIYLTMDERTDIAQKKSKYRVNFTKLSDLLDQAVVVDREIHSGEIINKHLKDASTRKMLFLTRRQFIKGLAVGVAATATYSIASHFGNSLGYSSEVSLLNENITKRQSVPETHNRIPSDQFAAILKSVIYDNYGVNYDLEDGIIYPTQREKLAGTSEWINGFGADLLQVHPSLYYNKLESKTLTYEAYLKDMYFPYLISKAKEMNLDINTLLGIMRISSENVGSEKRQNEDVKQGKIQLVLGALGWYMHREFGTDLPVDTLKSISYDRLGGPYDTARLNGQITLGMHDVELTEYANGLLSMPKSALSNYWLNYGDQHHFLKSINESKKEVAKYKNEGLNACVKAFVSENDPDKISEFFALLSDYKHDDWSDIGLGYDASFADIVRQTTRYSRVWAELCYLHGEGYDRTMIYKKSFQNARMSMVEQAWVLDYPEKALLLIGDQISNRKFRDWLLSKSQKIGGMVGVEKLLIAYDLFEEQGTYLKDDLASAWSVMAPMEYDWKFQIDTGLAYIKSLEDTVVKSKIFNSLSELNPMWKSFLTASIREIAPIPLLVEDYRSLPRMSEFDDPYNSRAVLESLESITVGLSSMMEELDADLLLRRIVEVLQIRRFDPDKLPNFVTDVALWNTTIEPHLKKLDLSHYSSLWRAIDVSSDFLKL